MALHFLSELDLYWSSGDRLGIPGIVKFRYRKTNQYLELVNKDDNMACSPTV